MTLRPMARQGVLAGQGGARRRRRGLELRAPADERLHRADAGTKTAQGWPKLRDLAQNFD